MDSHISLTPTSRILGYAGLLPQIFCVTLVAMGHEYRFTALFMGFVYAAAIFSFLGGVWWGQAIARAGQASAGVYIIAVIPSLIAAALFIPYNEGWEWPGPALLYLGAFIALSPLVDRRLGFAAKDFMRLRWHLSLGLGALTIALGFLAMQAMQPTVPLEAEAPAKAESGAGGQGDTEFDELMKKYHPPGTLPEGREAPKQKPSENLQEAV